MTNELVYPASRLKAALIFLGCGAFVAVGLLLSKEKPLIGWACVAFFGLGLPASILMLLPNKIYLKLTPEGFEVRSLFGGKLTRWSEVERFYVGSIRGITMIAIVYKASYADQQVLRKVSSAMAGMEGAFPNSYTSSREEILKTLNEWHTRYGRAGA